MTDKFSELTVNSNLKISGEQNCIESPNGIYTSQLGPIDSANGVYFQVGEDSGNFNPDTGKPFTEVSIIPLDSNSKVNLGREGQPFNTLYANNIKMSNEWIIANAYGTGNLTYSTTLELDCIYLMSISLTSSSLSTMNLKATQIISTSSLRPVNYYIITFGLDDDKQVLPYYGKLSIGSDGLADFRFFVPEDDMIIGGISTGEVKFLKIS